MVCGLASEAASIRKAFRAVEGLEPPLILVSGADPGRAETAARRLVDEGSDGLMSVGLCGGLCPDLQVGELVFATSVVEAGTGERHAIKSWFQPDPFNGLLPQWRVGPVLGCDHAITSPADKAAAFKNTGALAVDMESHAVARVAAREGLPMMVVRAVVDDAATTVPDFLAHAMGPSGRPRVVRLAGQLARYPGQLPALIRLARSSARAHASLEVGVIRVAKALRMSA
ncbi:MAG: hypothetical protein AAGB11_14515 [Pseudomonadota bacterium]